MYEQNKLWERTNLFRYRQNIEIKLSSIEFIADKMKALLTEYNAKKEKTFEDILDFYVKFERIYPFQDGNGRVGRLIMFKECLKSY